MKKILNYGGLLWLLLSLLTACEKTGPDGPEGPEGAEGNPGPPGNGASGGTGSVIAYTTAASNLFKWEDHVFAPGIYTLKRATSPTGSYQSSFYIEDEEGIVPDGIVLIYIQVKKENSTEEPVWLPLPHWLGVTADYESYEARQHYREASGNQENLLEITITGEIPQAPNVVRKPSYAASGVKVIIIPAGDTYDMGNRAANLRQLSLGEVMQRYHLKASAFRPIR